MEMPGSWKAWKSKSSFSPLSTPPWKSRQKREIPTFPQPGVAPDGKVENHNQVFHFPTRVARRQLRFILFSEPKTKAKKSGRSAAPPLNAENHVLLKTLFQIKNFLPRRSLTRYNNLSPGRGCWPVLK
jgi:hypothetical protein